MTIILIAAFLLLGATFSSKPSTPPAKKIDPSSSGASYKIGERLIPPPVRNQDPCVKLEMEITPDIVTEGETLTLKASLQNCSDATETIDIVYTITKNTLLIMVGKTTITLGAEETMTFEHERTVPANAPVGEYLVEAYAYVNDDLLTWDTDQLTIY